MATIPFQLKEVAKKIFVSTKVLIVDDMDANLFNYRKLLRGIGFTAENVGQAKNGLQALSAMATQKPTLIITDWNMPLTDGLTFVKKVRAIPANKGIIVIMVTAEPDKNMAEVNPYVNGFLKKPYTMQDLEDLLYTVYLRQMAAKKG